MCPFEEWLGFCPFAALSRLWRLVTGRATDTGWVSVDWVTRG
jgi:hypothetical protein